jgi:hypothetical protein
VSLLEKYITQNGLVEEKLTSEIIERDVSDGT